MRLAVGASRGRLLRQLATESLLISAGGAFVGLLIAAAGLRVFDAYRPSAMPAVNAAIDWRVLAFAIVIAVFAPVLFGVAPGAHALRLAIGEGLKARPLMVRPSGASPASSPRRSCTRLFLGWRQFSSLEPCRQPASLCRLSLLPRGCRPAGPWPSSRPRPSRNGRASGMNR